MFVHEVVPLLVFFGFLAFFMLNMIIWLTIDETLHGSVVIDVKKEVV